MGRSYGGHEVSPSAHMLAYSKTIDSRLHFMESFALQKKESSHSGKCPGVESASPTSVIKLWEGQCSGVL